MIEPEDSFKEINSVLQGFGGYVQSVNYDYNEFPVFYGNNPIYSAGRSQLDIKLKFTDERGLTEFFRTTASIVRYEEEQERIRMLHEKHSTLKNAYEEYQLLLKLYQ